MKVQLTSDKVLKLIVFDRGEFIQKEFDVFFSIRSLMRLQDEYGGLEEVMKKFKKGYDIDLDFVLRLLHIGLTNDGKKLSIEELEDGISFHQIGYVLKQILTSIIDSLPPMKEDGETFQEDIPEHIRKIQDQALGENSDEEIDWGRWHFIAIYIFRFSEDDFFYRTTLRRLYSLIDQYQKFNEKD